MRWALHACHRLEEGHHCGAAAVPGGWAGGVCVASLRQRCGGAWRDGGIGVGAHRMPVCAATPSMTGVRRTAVPTLARTLGIAPCLNTDVAHDGATDVFARECVCVVPVPPPTQGTSGATPMAAHTTVHTRRAHRGGRSYKGGGFGEWHG